MEFWMEEFNEFAPPKESFAKLITVYSALLFEVARYASVEHPKQAPAIIRQVNRIRRGLGVSSSGMRVN